MHRLKYSAYLYHSVGNVISFREAAEFCRSDEHCGGLDTLPGVKLALNKRLWIFHETEEGLVLLAHTASHENWRVFESPSVYTTVFGDGRFPLTFSSSVVH